MSPQTDKQPASLADTFSAIPWRVLQLGFVLFIAGFIWLLSTNRIFLLLRIFGGLFGVVGIAALVHGWRSLAKARASEDWFPVEGLVISSRLDVQTDRPSSDSREPSIDTYWP